MVVAMARCVLPGVHNSKPDMEKEVAHEVSVGLCFVQQKVHTAVPGLLTLKDLHAHTLFKSPWPVYPSLSVLLSSHGGRSRGEIRCSSSSVLRRSSPNVNASGNAEPIDELWEEYFADPCQWWDNRVDKRNPKSPDFEHKVTKKALWIDGWSTPDWVKERLMLGTKGKLQSHIGYGTIDPQNTAQSNRLPKNNNGRRNSVPTIAQEFRHSRECGSMHMKRASTMSEALAILKTRLQQGITIDSYMYVEVLKRCLKQKDLRAAKEIHECILKSGMEQDIFVATNLLSVYIRCGRLQDARRVFDGLLNKNGGYAQHSRAEDAVKIFNQMRQEGVQADEVTYLSILKAFVTPAALKWGREVHADIRYDGLESDLRVGSALVHMYAKCGSIDDAQLVFDRMEKGDVITWSIMIGGLAEHGRVHEAYELFLRMRREGCVPDAITYMSILNACASAGALEWVKEVHRHVMEAGLKLDLRVGNALVHSYSKSGSIDDARAVFDRMEDHDVITWDILIGGLAEHGRVHEAYELFLRMRREGFLPEAITFVCILNACASAGALEWVTEVHRHVQEAGLEKDLRVGSALVHIYARSGSIDDARQVFGRMGERDVVTWSAMIGGLAQHGRGHEALELFRSMSAGGVKHDERSFVSVLSACSHAGLIDEGRRFFSVMLLDYGIKPSVLHCNCMVDLLGRGGYMEEAKRFIDNLPVEPDATTWRALLGACRTYGNVELGELAANEVFKLEPKDASPYVLLSNIYAAAGKWEEVSLVRTLMQERGIRKEPGRS